MLAEKLMSMKRELIEAGTSGRVFPALEVRKLVKLSVNVLFLPMLRDDSYDS